MIFLNSINVERSSRHSEPVAIIVYDYNCFYLYNYYYLLIVTIIIIVYDTNNQPSSTDGNVDIVGVSQTDGRLHALHDSTNAQLYSYVLFL